MAVHDLPDLVGNGAAQPLVATRTMASWILFSVPVSANGTAQNTGVVRVGGKNVSASRGTQVSNFFGLTFWELGEGIGHDLSLIYFFAVANDKLQVTYGLM